MFAGNVLVRIDTELSKEPTTQRIEVRANAKIINEGRGWVQAHGKARKIGRKAGAVLVIWGNRVVDKTGFHPRITAVTDRIPPLLGERPLAVQNIDELSLPDELVDQLIYLAHFAAGYLFT